MLFFFPLASFAQESSEGSETIKEIGEIILDDNQIINVEIGVIILIIIIAGIVVVTRKNQSHNHTKMFKEKVSRNRNLEIIFWER